MRIRNNLLAKYFPELDRSYGQCETENLAIVRWCLDPGKIAGMEFDQFFQMVTTRERGIAQRRRLRKIHSLAVESIGCPMRQASEFEAMVLVDKLKQVRQVTEKTEDLIEDVSPGFPEYSWMLTIPGFGPYVSSIVLATIGNPFRFENRKKVLKVAGYDLSADRNYYTNLLCGRERERGIKTKMRVKLAAKLLIIVYPVKCEAYFTGAWTLMKKKEPFNPKYLKDTH